MLLVESKCWHEEKVMMRRPVASVEFCGIWGFFSGVGFG